MELSKSQGNSKGETETADSLLNCDLCGTPLVFRHVTDFHSLVVKEEAQCTSCRIRNRVSEHTLN